MKNKEITLKEFKQVIHTFMHSISPNCEYMVVLNEKNDDKTLQVASSFSREDTKQLLLELLMSLEDGSAIEAVAKVVRPGSSLN